MAQARSLQSPLLVGRDDVLALAERRIGEVRAGRGGFLIFAGEAGIGKSRLLGAVIRQATQAGFRYSKADLAPQDALVPLASIRDLARWMATDVFGVLGAELLEMRGGKGEDVLAARRILVREIAERISDAIDRPTILAFEDLQWADELSLEVMGDLARLGRGRQLLLLATYRLDEFPAGSIHRAWRSRLLTQRLAEEARVERLNAAQTALVTTLILATGLPAPREVAEAVFARTNGIPLHIEELLAALGDEVGTDGRSVRNASVPDTIEDAVLARTHHLGEEAQAVARAGAVLGRCFAPDVLAGIMDRPVADLDGPLQELVDSSILYPFEFIDQGYYDFRHQLLRDALYDSVPAGELRRLHARAGEFGARLLGATEIHASLHFERAGLRDQAFRAGLSGARAAAKLSSRYQAFELYRRAVANIPDSLPPATKGAIWEEFVEASFAVDDIAAIQEGTAAVRTHFQEAGDVLGAARALMARIGLARRDVRPRSDRDDLIRQVETELATSPAGHERAAAYGELRANQGMLELDAGRFDDSRALFEEARLLYREGAVDGTDIDYLEAIPRVLSGEVKDGLATMLDVARRAREQGLEASGVTAYRSAAAVAMDVMEYPTAALALQEGMRYAGEIQQSYCRHVMAATTAHLSWVAGRWDEAIQTAELELVERGSRRGALGSRNVLAFVAFGRGMTDVARGLLDESLAVSRPSGEVDLVLPALWGHAETALIAGEPARALEYCNEAVDLAGTTGERPLLIPFVVTGVRAAQADHRPDAAPDWLDRVTPLLRDWADLAGPPVAHAEGLIRLAAGSLVAARTSLEAAVRGWDARGRIWESTWARIDLATCLLRSNRFVEAGRQVAEIETTVRQLGGSPLQHRVDDLQRQARGHNSDEEAWYPLTVREFEVARQIAVGMTNAEIAVELFVSPKTVSAHVEHILAKLGASRRAEVAAWVARASQPVA